MESSDPMSDELQLRRPSADRIAAMRARCATMPICGPIRGGLAKEIEEKVMLARHKMENNWNGSNKYINEDKATIAFDKRFQPLIVTEEEEVVNYFVRCPNTFKRILALSDNNPDPSKDDRRVERLPGYFANTPWARIVKSSMPESNTAVTRPPVPITRRLVGCTRPATRRTSNLPATKAKKPKQKKQKKIKDKIESTCAIESDTEDDEEAWEAET